MATATLKPIVMTSFPRGDTPLLIIPVTRNAAAVDITGYTGYLTFTVNGAPATNSDAFLHTAMLTSPADTLGVGYSGYFYYQFTNNDTENFDPSKTYNWDVQINKQPSATNNFTIAVGTFTPLVDYSRGLS